jgi:hypothetical protein
MPNPCNKSAIIVENPSSCSLTCARKDALSATLYAGIRLQPADLVHNPNFHFLERDWEDGRDTCIQIRKQNKEDENSESANLRKC